MRTKYVAQLEKDLQINVQSKLIKYFSEELELNPNEIEIELEIAMNSRVSDLEDTINIQEIINNY